MKENKCIGCICSRSMKCADGQTITYPNSIRCLEQNCLYRPEERPSWTTTPYYAEQEGSETK